MQSNISYLYNPASQTPENLIDNFTARQKEFKRIMRDIKQSKIDEISQNFLITAQRGMGKTTLLLRLEYEVNATAELAHLIPIRFSEEQYNIVSFCNLWEVVVDVLEDKIDGFCGIVEQVEDSIASDNESCFEPIKKALQKNSKKLLLLVDNFQDILNKFTDNEIKELRDILHSTELQLVSASSIAIENTYHHDKPFFEFFKSIQLNGLSTIESQELFKKLAENHPTGMQNYDASRIEIVKHLTGGVPRTMIIIFEIFLDRNADIFENLEYILDQVTPLYKHIMDDLPLSQQRIAHEIAIAWNGISFEELKKKTRTDEEELIGYLLELEKAYFIDVRSVGTTVNIYLLKERFFNIWYLMRKDGIKNQERIKWLIKFLKKFTVDELREKALEHIKMVQQGKINYKKALYMGETLACLVDESRLKHNILSSTKNFLNQVNPNLAKEIHISKIENILSIKEIFFCLTWNKIKNFFFSFLGEDTEYYKDRGHSYYWDKNYKKAIVSLEKAIFNLSCNYCKDKQYKDYKMILSCYYELGGCYSSLGNNDKAIEIYQYLIKLNPQDYWAYYSIGFQHHKKRDYNEGIKFYKKAIKLNPKDERLYSAIGRSYHDKGHYDNAIIFYQKAIKLNSKYEWVYYDIGLSFFCKNNYDETIKFYQKGFKLNKSKTLRESGIYIPYLLVIEECNNSFKVINELLTLYDYLEFKTSIVKYFLYLVINQEYNILNSIFKVYLNLKNEFKPVYYTLMYFMQDEYPTEYPRMGAELEETVQEMVDEVGRLREKYGD